MQDRFWMQKAFGGKKGALHRQLGYGPKAHIPHGLEDEIYDANIGTHVRGHKVTTLLKHRVIAAVNARRR